jgi:hypothetical protein
MITYIAELSVKKYLFVDGERVLLFWKKTTTEKKVGNSQPCIRKLVIFF